MMKWFQDNAVTWTLNGGVLGASLKAQTDPKVTANPSLKVMAAKASIWGFAQPTPKWADWDVKAPPVVQAIYGGTRRQTPCRSWRIRSAAVAAPTVSIRAALASHAQARRASTGGPRRAGVRKQDGGQAARRSRPGARSSFPTSTCCRSCCSSWSSGSSRWSTACTSASPTRRSGRRRPSSSVCPTTPGCRRILASYTAC